MIQVAIKHLAIIGGIDNDMHRRTAHCIFKLLIKFFFKQKFTF